MEKSGKGTEASWGGRGETARVEWSHAQQAGGRRAMNNRSDLPIILWEEGDGHLPPEAVAVAARKGLALREKLKRAGTTVGAAHARELQNRKPLRDAVIRQMARFFARHRVDKRAENWGEEDRPSADYVAWLLWGGDPGREWALRRLAQLDDADATRK